MSPFGLGNVEEDVEDYRTEEIEDIQEITIWPLNAKTVFKELFCE